MTEEELGGTKPSATLGDNEVVGDLLLHVCCFTVFAKNKLFKNLLVKGN